MQANIQETVRLINNAVLNSGVWAFELNNTREQQFLLRIDNDVSIPFSVEYFAAATNTIVKSDKTLQLEAEDGDLILKSTELIRSRVPHQMETYTRAGLPALSASGRGSQAYLLDGADNYPVYFNGSSWLKISDNTSA